MDREIEKAWKAMLARHELSQAGLARLADISQTVVSNYVNARIRPRPETMRRIADALGEDYQALREELYPTEGGDDLQEVSVEEVPSHVISARQACLELAASMLCGTDGTPDHSAVTALAEHLERWILRPV